MKKTYQKKGSEIERAWHEVDAGSAPLGRMASGVARLLSGKHKSDYTPHLDMGDYVVVTNAKEVRVTGGKEKQKKDYKHSGYPGGFKEVAFSKYKSEQPGKIIELAVSGMLPKNKLRKPRLRRLKVFEGGSHPYKLHNGERTA